MNSFLEKIKAGAISGQKKYGVLASLTMAQAVLETGWGKASVGNNIFGIKADAGWTGPTTEALTQEWCGGKYVTVMAGFRSYTSVDASVEDHAKFLFENSRYKNIIGCTDYKKVCENIQADGYATDPQYAAKLISIIESNNLTLFDKVAVWCDTTKDFSKSVGDTYQFKSRPDKVTCGDGSIWKQVSVTQSGPNYLTKFQAVKKGSAGFYVNGVRQCIGIVA
jgi:flagellum-specific peptidoglycan hydrolase FlgJ